MNYQKIYQDFIASRRLREADIVGYSEKHHIVPKALGGGNEKANLIRLTPEDHFFAHLLLARIHGRKMWAAVAAMGNLARTARWGDALGVVNRLKFAHVRAGLARHYREANKGLNNPNADKNTYELKHIDGRDAAGGRLELERKTGVTGQQLTTLIHGIRKTACGWYCTAHNPFGKTGAQRMSEAKRSKDVYELHHINGATWRGTKHDFFNEFGIRLSITKTHKNVVGWYEKEEDALNHHARRRQISISNSESRGNISGRNNPNVDRNEYRVFSTVTNQAKTGTRLDIAEFFGVSRQEIGVLVTGVQKISKGLRLC